MKPGHRRPDSVVITTRLTFVNGVYTLNGESSKRGETVRRPLIVSESLNVIESVITDGMKKNMVCNLKGVPA